MIKLTTRQKEVLACIQQHIDHTGYPPTRAEIANNLGFRSVNAAEDHLKALARKGVIEIIGGASRGIRLLTDAEAMPSGLPVIGRVAAGSPILATQHIDSYAAVNASLFAPAANYLLKVFGDSMIEAGIFDGDTVLIKKQQTATNGEIVVALVDGEEATLKRLRKKGNSVALEAANEAYETRIFGPDQVSVQGRLVGLFRKY